MALMPMYPGQPNSPQTELAENIDETQTTIPLLDASVLPPGPNLVVIGSGERAETVLYESIDGDNLINCTRGFQGVASSWQAGQKVARNFTAYDYDALRQNLKSHGSEHNHDGADPIPDLVQLMDGFNAHLDETMQLADEIVTVGSGGDFNTINDAITYFSLKTPIYKKAGLRAEIKLLSGFVMQEQVLIDGIDLGWIRITSEDPVVTISRQYLTERFGEEPANETDESDYLDPNKVHVINRPAFGACNNATLPIIDVLFDMDDTGDHEGCTGFSVTNNSRLIIMPYKGCINAGDNGLYVTQSSWAHCYRANFDNAGRSLTADDATSQVKLSGVLVFRGSWVNIRQAKVTNASNDGIYFGSSSVVEALGADFSNAGRYGVYGYAGGRINIRDGKAVNCGRGGVYATQATVVEARGFDVSQSRFGFFAESGSTIDADEAIAKNCSNIGVRATKSSVINFHNGDASGAGDVCVQADRGSTINAHNVSARKNIGSDSPEDIVVAFGGIINARAAQGGLNQNANEITYNGIIFQ